MTCTLKDIYIVVLFKCNYIFNNNNYVKNNSDRLYDTHIIIGFGWQLCGYSLVGTLNNLLLK